MQSEEMLIIRPSYILSEHAKIRLYEDLRKQMKAGNLLIIPQWCEVICKPENVSIVMSEGPKDEFSVHTCVDILHRI